MKIGLTEARIQVRKDNLPNQISLEKISLCNHLVKSSWPSFSFICSSSGKGFLSKRDPWTNMVKTSVKLSRPQRHM